MLPREILKQVRRLHIRAKKAVEETLGGEYHSIFKGAGMAFDEVREYQPGDDVRSIDWNVTARMSRPFVKRHIEDRERTVLLAVDTSGSLHFGTGLATKREVAAELAAVLAFSAISNNDRIGLVNFTDRIEHQLPAKKGTKHVLRLIRDVLFFQPQSKRTSLTTGLDYINRAFRRRAIVFLFSDFLDPDFEDAFRRTAKRHELIAIRLSDPREQSIPPVGLVEFIDTETDERRRIDTNDPALRLAYQQISEARRELIHNVAKAAGVDLIETSTDGKHLEALVRFFRVRS
jgi:uncharacterized protein (DUF58 family)